MSHAEFERRVPRFRVTTALAGLLALTTPIGARAQEPDADIGAARPRTPLQQRRAEPVAQAVAGPKVAPAPSPVSLRTEPGGVALPEISVETARDAGRETPGPSGSAAPTGVVPAYAGGQVARGGRVGVLGNVDAKKSPFSVASYTDTLVRDRQARTVSEALILDPSVRATQTTGAPFDSFAIRGFPSNEGTSGEFAFDGIYGVAPSFRVFTDYAERIEVMKGPTAALSGVAPNGGVGGVINVVPKRASEDLTRLTFDYGSVARGGSGFDVARRYGDAREWGVRLVGSVRGGATPFDRQSELAGVGAVAVDYQGDRFRAWLYMLGQTDSFTAPLRPYLLAAGVPVPRAPDGRLNVSQPWEYSNIHDRGGLLRTEYDLTDQITLFADVGGSRTDVDRYFTSAPTILDVRGNTSSNPGFYGAGIDRFTYDGGVRAKFDTGFIRHAFVVQASSYNEDTGRFLSAGSGAYRSNLYAPALAPYRAGTMSGAHPRLSDSTLTGISVADTLSILDEHVLLTVGGRQQTIEAHNYTANVGTLSSSYDKSAMTPLVGLVLRPNDTLSLYANYIEGLSRGDVAPTTATNSGQILAPYVAQQIEAGLKLDLGGFGAGFSAFQIDRPIGELSPSRVYAQSGVQRVSGVELTAYGQLAPELRVVGGLSLLDGVLTKTALAANVGNTPLGVPKVQLNLGAEWDLPWIRGLTLNGAVVYTSRQFVDTANTQALPDWARLDLGVRYTTLLEGTRTTFRANVLNVTGTNYWTGVASFGTFFQGAPRTYLLSMSVDL